jgi:DNA-binding response OmpR family regulator
MRKVDASLPIIAMSGMGNSNLLETARKLGATDILAKPFEPDEMLGKVAALVR